MTDLHSPQQDAPLCKDTSALYYLKGICLGQRPLLGPWPAQGYIGLSHVWTVVTAAKQARLLQEAGLSSTAARDKWPLEVLRKVLQGLGAEVPSQLLARELLCGAASAADWLQRQRAFASSAAVMSMVRP